MVNPAMSLITGSVFLHVMFYIEEVMSYRLAEQMVHSFVGVWV